MALGEALTRCPELELVLADPLAVAEAWEGILCVLEGIGAAIEPAREGLAYFDADGLRGIDTASKRKRRAEAKKKKQAELAAKKNGASSRNGVRKGNGSRKKT